MFKFDRRSQSAATPEKNIGEHLTVPGMALDIGKAITRMQQGMEIKTYVPQYTSELEINEEDVAHFESLDRVERLQWAAEKRLELNQMRSNIVAQLEADKAAEKAAADKEAEIAAKSTTGGNSSSDE